MKNLYLLAICMVFVFASQAQSIADEIALVQSAYGMSKKELIVEHMKITDTESATFWKLYDEYELYRSEIIDRRGENIQQYTENYTNITDAKAAELLKNTFEINNELNKLWQKTYNTMAKELSPVKAGQFIYLEMYFEGLGRVKLSEAIPHIGAIEPIKK